MRLPKHIRNNTRTCQSTVSAPFTRLQFFVFYTTCEMKIFRTRLYAYRHLYGLCHGSFLARMGVINFFNELEAFIHTCERQSGRANRSFAEYALEQIQTAIQSVSFLLNHVKNATPNSDTESSVRRLLCQIVTFFHA